MKIYLAASILLFPLFAHAQVSDPQPRYRCEISLSQGERVARAEFLFKPGRSFSRTEWSSAAQGWVSREGAPDFNGVIKASLDSYGGARLSFLRADGVGAEAESFFAPGANAMKAGLRFAEKGAQWHVSLLCQYE